MNTTNTLLQGNVDTSFKLDKRTTLGTIKSVADLEDRLQALTSGQHTVMEHIETNLKIVLMGAGYTAEDAASLAHDSPVIAKWPTSACTCTFSMWAYNTVGTI
jgi:hypothetical protein